MRPMRRVRLPATGWLGLLVGALVGCAHTVAGNPVFDAAAPIGPLHPDDAAQVLVPAQQVSDIVGSRLQVDADRSRPVSGSSAVPACSALDTAGMAAFVGDAWSGFRVLLLTDGDRHDRVVAEAVAVYPDAETAATAFRAGTSDVRACDGQRAVSTGSEAAWRFSVQEDTTDSVAWTKHQLAIPMTWVCHGEARLRINTLVQAMACQGDDGGELLATRLTDRMSASVWELAGR